ncbi:hypothetical protein O181_014931 [Austropuccinia psidii MF-1]|uniref:Uncharacterized protein n=1 Tax=Austropuccinia psidii MF-1 TaxID=1389203 RepID=A0A9Q3BZ15_9BASI|nr:hypothetical protein [Austropuccinia psidii MF-1]
MEHRQQEVQPSISLGRTWRNLPEDMSQRLQRPYGSHQRLEFHQEFKTPGGEVKPNEGESSHYPSHRRAADPNRAYSDSFRLKRSRPNQFYSGFIPFRNQNISGQESPFFTNPGSFLENTRIQGQKQDLFRQRQKTSDPMIQKLLDLVKEVQKSQKQLYILLESVAPLIELLPPLRLNIMLLHLKVT